MSRLWIVVTTRDNDNDPDVAGFHEWENARECLATTIQEEYASRIEDADSEEEEEELATALTDDIANVESWRACNGGVIRVGDDCIFRLRQMTVQP